MPMASKETNLSFLRNPAKVGTCLSSTSPFNLFICYLAWDIRFIYLFRD